MSKTIHLIIISSLFSLISFSAFAETRHPKIIKKPVPKIEVVFALDTTGSMSNLIDVAKSKIWSIANQLVTAEPRPEVKIGLVAYRDIGDVYVTQVTGLTSDIDDIYEKLHALKAQGGGDGPEHVNQALQDSLTKIQWDKGKNTLRLIFLAGDATAHDDYNDGLNSEVLAKKIAAAGIHLNTIRCGSAAGTQIQFEKLAMLGNGNYASIKNGTRVVTTPYDRKLAELNTKLAHTMVGYGNRKARRKSNAKKAKRMSLSSSDAASNASYSAKSGRMNNEDLLQALSDGKTLESVPKNQLSDKMQKMTVQQRTKYVAKLQKERKRLQKKILALSKKRDSHIRKELKKVKSKNSFDRRVMDTLAAQAEEIGVSY